MHRKGLEKTDKADTKPIQILGNTDNIRKSPNTQKSHTTLNKHGINIQ